MSIYLKSSISYFRKILNQGHERSIKAKKNILALFFIKGSGIAISLLLVPLTIHYVNPSQYGIWLTISSIIGWFSFFDIGLSHGLRNKFAEAKANKDDDLAQIYVSTTYAIITIIFFCLWLIFLLIQQFVNWASILKLPYNMQEELSVLVLIVFTYFCIQFILSIVTSVITADQQPAKASFIQAIGQALALLFIFILIKTTEGSLIKLAIALCIAPIITLTGANFFFFKRTYQKYKPRFSKIKFSYARNLFHLGFLFFAINISYVIQFETANIIIARNYGTTDVTAYNIVYKYFGLLSMLFTIFLTPFWSASTEAYIKNDIKWIKKGMRQYNYLNLFLAGIGIIMLLLSTPIYDLWLGKGTIDIDWSLSLWGFIYFNAFIFGSKYVNFLNGISALRLQFYTSVISPFVFILVSIILIKHYKMGTHALFIASIIANFNGLFLAPIQYYKITYQNKKGIWVK